MQRAIDLQGCLNFRDLGGYPTADGRRLRWRQLYRSDALHLLTPPDVARLRDELGVREVIDLRSTAERREEVAGPLGPPWFREHHIPLFDGEVRSAEQRADIRTLADRYFLMAEFAREAIGRVLTVLGQSPSPAVFHCAAGKDRTGVVSAVILATLGVEDDLIVADYVATQAKLDAIIDRLMSTRGYQTMLSALPPDTLHAEPETMVALLERVREVYGSMRDYVRAAGVDEATLRSLETRLLEA